MYRVLSQEEKRSRSRSRSTVTILIATPLRERLEELAEVNDRSLGAEARVAIREHLEREAVHRHLRDPESMRTKP